MFEYAKLHFSCRGIETPYSRFDTESSSDLFDSIPILNQVGPFLVDFEIGQRVRYSYRYQSFRYPIGEGIDTWCFDTPSRGIDTPGHFSPSSCGEMVKSHNATLEVPKTCLNFKMNVKPKNRHLAPLKR